MSSDTTEEPPGGDPYESHKRRTAARQETLSAAGREIGAIPPIKNIRRRARTRKSLKLFCETYNPATFYLPWSPSQIRSAQRIEEAIRHGALYAFAEPRGDGKTSRVRMAALWAISHGLLRYVFIIGANSTKAEENLDAIKTMIRFLPLYREDFPEIAWPAIRLGGIANKVAGQTCGGRPTLMAWSSDRIILPTVPPPGNWPKSWPLRVDGLVPSAGSVLVTSGLTGDGIRGSALTLSTGETIRPDLVMLDDPQTNESANSPLQNATREQLVSADVLGMAGPDRAISAVMPCTVIAEGDFVDRILDRSKHPMWRGERTSILKSMPSDMRAWAAYFEVYARCALKDSPDFEESNAHYLEHRETLDAGAEPAWAERKKPWEISAIQSAMHLYFRNPSAFFAEYMNRPKRRDESSEAEQLTSDGIMGRAVNIPRGIVPAGTTRVTACVDVQGTLLYYVVVAWNEGFGGQVIDYGSWPGQNRDYFTLEDARRTFQSEFPGLALEACVYAALDKLCDKLLAREWRDQPGGEVTRIGRCLVDANWGQSTDAVYQFCRQSSWSAILVPSHGKGMGPDALPMDQWRRQDGDHHGLNWRISRSTTARKTRHVLVDTNWWKTFTAERLRTPAGSAGALMLFGGGGANHRMFADHCAREYRTRTAGRNREVDVWKLRPGSRENHLWDCLVGCGVAASIQGLQWSAAAAAGRPPSAPPPRPKKKPLAERFRAKTGGRP